MYREVVVVDTEAHHPQVVSHHGIMSPRACKRNVQPVDTPPSIHRGAGRQTNILLVLYIDSSNPSSASLQFAAERPHGSFMIPILLWNDGVYTNTQLER